MSLSGSVTVLALTAHLEGLGLVQCFNLYLTRLAL